MLQQVELGEKKQCSGCWVDEQSRYKLGGQKRFVVVVAIVLATTATGNATDAVSQICDAVMEI